MIPNRLLENIHMHIVFYFLQRQLEELEQESLVLKKKNFF